MFIRLLRVIYFVSGVYESELAAYWMRQPLQLAVQLLLLHGRVGDQLFVILHYQSITNILVNYAQLLVPAQEIRNKQARGKNPDL